MDVKWKYLQNNWLLMEYWILCKHLGKWTQPCSTNLHNWVHITQDKVLIWQYGIVVSNRISSCPSDPIFLGAPVPSTGWHFPLSPWVPKAAGRCHHTKCKEMVLVILGRPEGYFPVTFYFNRHIMCLRWGSFFYVCILIVILTAGLETSSVGEL